MTKLEQERSDRPSQVPSFAEIVETTNFVQNMVYTPSSPYSPVRIEKLKYTTCEVEHEQKLIQVKVTHSCVSTTFS